MTIKPEIAVELEHWMRERESIRRLKEQGAAPPWTGDEILGNWRFCNARRSDDKVTRWIVQNIAKRFGNERHLWFMFCIARMINWPDTLAELIEHGKGAWPEGEHWDPEKFLAVLQAREARREKVFTGAYKIPAPRGGGKGSKAPWIARVVLGQLWQDREKFATYFESGTDLEPLYLPRYLDRGRCYASTTKATLRGTFMRLSRYEGWGPFLSYQAVVDMRFSRLLDNAPDIETFAAAGPGTIRGLNRLHGRRLDYELSQDAALRELRELYRMVQRRVPEIAIDFSDAPNLMCELDKYLRANNDEGQLKNRYTPKKPPRMAAE